MTIIERILLELSAKEVVEDGMPDFTNEKHLLALNEVLIDLNWPMEARGELLYTLMEKVDPEAEVKYTIKNKDGDEIEKTTTYKNAIQMDKKHPGYIAAKKLQGEKGNAGGETGTGGPNIFSNPGDAVRKPTGTNGGETGNKKVVKKKPMNREDVDSLDGDAKKNFFLPSGHKDKTTAPGTSASAINEMGTGWGMTVLSDNPNATDKEIADGVEKVMQENGFQGSLSQKHRESIARSARREYVRVNQHIKNTKMSENTKISHVWGSKQSLSAVEKRLIELKNGKPPVKEVNGISIDDYIKIVKGGGGGGDPTDTMIVMIDEDSKPPKVEILHTSNKMSTKDIQSNSGPRKSLDTMNKRLKAKGIDESKTLKKASDDIEKLDKEINTTVGEETGKFSQIMDNDDYAQNVLDSLTGIDGPVMVGGSAGNPDKYWKAPVLTNSVVKTAMTKKYGKDWKNQITDADKLEIIKIYAKDVKRQFDDGEELGKGDVRILSKIGAGMETITDGNVEATFDEEEVNKLYQKQFNVMNNVRKKLNEKHDGAGDDLFKEEMIDRLHLNVAEGHNPGSKKDDPSTPDVDESSSGIPADRFELNMGRNESPIKYHKETGDMYKRIGKKYIKIDPKTGKPFTPKVEATSGEVNDGNTATIATPEIIAGCITGKKAPLDKDTLKNNITVSEKTTEEISITGKSRNQTYIIYDMSDPPKEICRQTLRSKTGLGGSTQDTLQWSDDMQACMQRKSYLKANKK